MLPLSSIGGCDDGTRYVYLYGEKFYASSEASRPKEDGEELVYKTVKLGYWRKHPDLHGYIVETFADGKDECQRIELDGDNEFDAVITAIKNDLLPHTEGFFFGASRNDADEKRRAKVKEPGVWRTVYYEASW